MASSGGDPRPPNPGASSAPSKSAPKPKHSLPHVASDLTGAASGTTKRREELRGKLSHGGPQVPSGLRVSSNASSSHQRASSFSIPHSGSSGQNGQRLAVDASLADARPRGLRSGTPATDSAYHHTPLGNIARLQRTDLIKARNGSVLSRGLMLKTDFYPTGKSMKSWVDNHDLPRTNSAPSSCIDEKAVRLTWTSISLGPLISVHHDTLT